MQQAFFPCIDHTFKEPLLIVQRILDRTQIDLIAKQLVYKPQRCRVTKGTKPGQFSTCKMPSVEFLSNAAGVA
jgi:hypothetical protein